MNLQEQKYYFISDAHLGIPGKFPSLERERALVNWLDKVSDDAAEIFLLGDIFDFWFEYRKVVPKGFVRLLGKLAELTDKGKKISFFTGNHDMWMYNYFTEELNIPIYKKPIIKEIYGKRFLIGHGDGLGPRDFGYKFIKKVFANNASQWLFARLHPNFGLALANYFSNKSRISNGITDNVFRGEDSEFLILYAKEILLKEHYDYFVFGHRHLPIVLLINENSRYVNLGDWVNNFSYGVFDGSTFEIKYYDIN